MVQCGGRIGPHPSTKFRCLLASLHYTMWCQDLNSEHIRTNYNLQCVQLLLSTYKLRSVCSAFLGARRSRGVTLQLVRGWDYKLPTCAQRLSQSLTKYLFRVKRQASCKAYQTHAHARTHTHMHAHTDHTHHWLKVKKVGTMYMHVMHTLEIIMCTAALCSEVHGNYYSNANLTYPTHKK